MGFGENIPNIGAETKELPKETLEKTRKLCADYHKQLDQTTYFDSKAINLAGKLLQSFKEIKQENLPPSVKLVVKHRMAYLSFVASLAPYPAVGAFFDSFKLSNVDTNSPEALFEKIRKDEKFKALSSLDLLQVSSSLGNSLRALAQVNSAISNWGVEATSVLKPAGRQDADTRVDDEQASHFLEIGFRKTQKFVDYAKTQIYKK